MVSFSPLHVKTDIAWGVLNAFFISAVVAPAAFILRYRSVCLIFRFNIASTW
ncbi:hypothetical protein EZS27_029166, partial [termite gut metagenome]